jgi:protein-disulfide isomerase
MNKKQGKETVSKRQAIREQRIKKQRQQRIMVIFGISLIALLFAALLVLPGIQAARAPVGEITQITPMPRPPGEGAALGDPNAPVLIEVFEDFQCPACQTYSELVEPQIIQELVETGQVRYVFRHYPFIDDNSASRESDQAANASMCAAEQGRFWDYHDMLYANWNSENQGAFADKRLVAFAETLELDMDDFNACFRENRYESQIQADEAAGRQMGVTGTPSVFVNGKNIKPGYVPTFEDVQLAVQEALSQ